MQEILIGGIKRLVFVVTEGDAARVVIPLDNLSSIDYKRLSDMASKGGELMAVMRDTRLDNGMNALNQYKDMLIVVPKEKDEKAAELAPEAPAEPEQRVRRGPGRPPKQQG